MNKKPQVGKVCPDCGTVGTKHDVSVDENVVLYFCPECNEWFREYEVDE